MVVDKIEQTLSGGYSGLYGEVVTYDWYRMKELQFTPDFILDMGANVGVFTRFARSLFPYAFIVAIEPDEENFKHLCRFTPPEKNLRLINIAIGQTDIYKVRGAINGAHEIYINDPGVDNQKSSIGTVMPDKLIEHYLKEGMKSVVKLDIEGNELKIWDHQPSMDALKKIDYFTGEIHWSMLTGRDAQVAKEKSLQAIHSFGDTHNIVMDASSFWLTKK